MKTEQNIKNVANHGLQTHDNGEEPGWGFGRQESRLQKKRPGIGLFKEINTYASLIAGKTGQCSNHRTGSGLVTTAEYQRITPFPDRRESVKGGQQIGGAGFPYIQRVILRGGRGRRMRHIIRDIGYLHIGEHIGISLY